MSPDRATRTTRALGWVVGAGFFLLGFAELVTRLDEPLTLLFWLPTLWGGAALVLLGVFHAPPGSTLAAALVAVGTTAGLLASAWTIAMPLLGIALVYFAVIAARRPAPPAAG